MSTYKLCCIFNYAPLYRQNIYQLIDNNYDTQFYFGRNVKYGKLTNIKQLDYSIFKKDPIFIENKTILHIPWRTGIWYLPMISDYDGYLLTGDFQFSYLLLIFFAKLKRKKIYCWGHGLKNNNGKLKYFVRWMFNSMDGIFLYGKKGKKRMEELGYKAEKLHVIYNSINICTSRNYSKENQLYNHFNNTLRTVIFIGRLTKEKQLDKLILWLSESIYKKSLYNLIIIGDGEEKDYLKDLAKENNINDYVWFYGECYDDSELGCFLYYSDLCVSPGNVGLTAIHAMSYGLPVISHNNFYKQGPEYEAIIPYKTGLLYEYNDYEDMKIKIEKWFSLHIDRETIRENCYNIVEKYYNTNYQINLLKKIIQ